MAQTRGRPVVFVVDHDKGSLENLLSDLRRRYDASFVVEGDISVEAALAVLRDMATAGQPVAMVLVEDATSDLLAPAHELHPRAKRVLLVDRDYTSKSPAVAAMTFGHVDYHIVRPWADDEMIYGPMNEYLSAWLREHEPAFELFRIVAAEDDQRASQLRDVMTRFGMPNGFYPVDSEAGRRLLREARVD